MSASLYDSSNKTSLGLQSIMLGPVQARGLGECSVGECSRVDIRWIVCVLGMGGLGHLL